MLHRRRAIWLLGASLTIFPSQLWARSFRHRFRKTQNKGRDNREHLTGLCNVTPSAEAWGALRRGMTEGEVLKLLGEPVRRNEPVPNVTSDVTIASRWDYGDRCFESVAFPEPFHFYILLIDGRVDEIVDPFDRAVSRGGIPTVPKQILPSDMAVFEHYPRFVDLRWTPSAGDLPLTYDIEVAVESANMPERYSATSPYLAIAFSGKQRGRWRVRARNPRGTSDWSGHREFRFDV